MIKRPLNIDLFIAEEDPNNEQINMRQASDNISLGALSDISDDN